MLHFSTVVNQFRSLLRRRAPRRSASASPGRRRCRPALESLEPREVPALDVVPPVAGACNQVEQVRILAPPTPLKLAPRNTATLVVEVDGRGKVLARGTAQDLAQAPTASR